MYHSCSIWHSNNDTIHTKKLKILTTSSTTSLQHQVLEALVLNCQQQLITTTTTNDDGNKHQYLQQVTIMTKTASITDNEHRQQR